MYRIKSANNLSAAVHLSPALSPLYSPSPLPDLKKSLLGTHSHCHASYNFSKFIAASCDPLPPVYACPLRFLSAVAARFRGPPSLLLPVLSGSVSSGTKKPACRISATLQITGVRIPRTRSTHPCAAFFHRRMPFPMIQKTGNRYYPSVSSLLVTALFVSERLLHIIDPRTRTAAWPGAQSPSPLILICPAAQAPFAARTPPF